MLVLSDEVISGQFQSLTPDKLLAYQDTLLEALIEYSKDPSIIPPRVVQQTPYGATHLFMTSHGTHVGMKAITASKKGLQGITTILDRETGEALAVINGATLTAFRTALCTTIALVKMYPPSNEVSDETLIVFGVGDQALWHVRLALILYPKRFTNVVCINRTKSKAEDFCELLKGEHPNIKFNPLGSSEKQELIAWFENATVCFSCVPTTEPTITLDLVAKVKGRLFIGVIGSYRPPMIEISGEVLNEVLKTGKKIIVDSCDHCLHEAGEFIQNNIGRESLIECAQLKNEDVDGKIVISKLVGLCVMDVWVGAHCLEQAKRENRGLEVAF